MVHHKTENTAIPLNTKDGFITVGGNSRALKAHTGIKNREVPHFLKPQGLAMVQRSIKQNIWTL